MRVFTGVRALQPGDQPSARLSCPEEEEQLVTRLRTQVRRQETRLTCVAADGSV